MADKDVRSSESDDALGGILGIAFIFMTAAWLFVKHSSEIYSYLVYGALVCAVPYLLTLIVWGLGNDKQQHQLFTTVFGIALAVVMYCLTIYGFDNLPIDVIQHSKRVSNGWNFWNSLTSFGQDSVGGNMLGALCLAIAMLLTLIMGIYVFWQTLTDSEHEDSWVLNGLHFFRPKKTIWVIVVLLCLSWSLNSGLIFTWLASLKVAVI